MPEKMSKLDVAGVQQPLSERALALLEDGRHEDAVEACRMGTELAPELAAIHVTLGNALAQVG